MLALARGERAGLRERGLGDATHQGPPTHSKPGGALPWSSRDVGRTGRATGPSTGLVPSVAASRTADRPVSPASCCRHSQDGDTDEHDDA